MPTIITEETIKNWIINNKNIESADVACAEGIKYDFRLGTKFLKSYFGRMVDFTELSNEERRHALVKPGEVVYVLTEEKLDLPKDIFVQLSPKRKLSHRGIILLGGLTVDPGYKGNMIFGLCNLSSTDFILDPGKKLVGAVFYKLSGDETIDYKPPEPLYDFPEEVISIIKQYKPIETLFLSEEVKRISDEVGRISRTLEADNRWKIDFQKGLSDIQKLVQDMGEKIGEMGEKLSEEIDTRKNENLALSNKNIELSKDQLVLQKTIIPLSHVQQRYEFLKGALVTLVIGIIVGVIVYFITKQIG